jgi:hypothetical protein
MTSFSPVQEWRIAKNGRVHRKRFIQYPNGDEYNGEMINGVREGFGILSTSKFQYNGSFRKGLFDGQGSFTWNNFKENGIDVIGRRYIGSFRMSRRDGKGTLHDGFGGIWNGEWKEDQFHGQGTVVKIDGETLEGNFRNGKLHCDDGKINFSNEDVYQGPLHFGNLHGNLGHLKYHGFGNGAYTGQFHYNAKHGIGTRRFMSGSTYRGNFLNNNITGQGTMHYESSDKYKSYKGAWLNGLFHGKGTLLFHDNFKIKEYRGEFSNGFCHGHGYVLYRDGGYYDGLISSSDSLLQISILPGLKDGHGIRVWASGNTFEGTYVQDQMKEGKFFDKNNSSTYVGTFVNDKKCGSGREIWKSKDNKPFCDSCLGWKHGGNDTCKYIGEYKVGYCHGHGILTCSDGRKYEGDWQYGKPHGFGVSILLASYKRGDRNRMYIGRHGSLYKALRYEGTWAEGIRHGKGKLIFLDGSTKEGRFTNGHFISSS